MPKGIKKTDWDEVHQIACDIANALLIDDEVLFESRKAAMFDTLDQLRLKYGEHPSLLATIGDYLDGQSERMKYYKKALEIARAQNNADEIELILDSIAEIEL